MTQLIELFTLAVLMGMLAILWQIHQTIARPQAAAGKEARPIPRQGNADSQIDNLVDPETVKLGQEATDTGIPDPSSPPPKPLWDDIEKLKGLIDEGDAEDNFDEDSLAGLGPVDKQRAIADRILELEMKRDGRLNNGAARR